MNQSTFFFLFYKGNSLLPFCAKALLVFLLCLCWARGQAQVDDVQGPLVLDSLLELGQELGWKGENKEGLRVIDLAKARAGKIYGEESREFARCKCHEGRLLSNGRQYREARPVLEAALPVVASGYGDTSRPYAFCLFALADMDLSTRNMRGVEKKLQTVEGILNTLGDTSSYFFAKLTQARAIYYNIMGDFERSEPLFLRVVDLMANAYGDKSLPYAEAFGNLGILYALTSYYEKSVEFQLKALDLIRRNQGADHPAYAMHLSNLCGTYQDMGLLKEAEMYGLKSMELNRQSHGEEDMLYGHAMNNLATLYSSMGNLDRARELLSKARAIYRKQVGEKSYDFANAQMNLASIYLEEDRFSEALALYKEVQQIVKEASGENNYYYSGVLLNIGVCHASAGNWEQAEEYLEKAREIRRGLAPQSLGYATVLTQLANLYRVQERFGEALALFIEARDIHQRIKGMEEWEYSKLIQLMGLLHWGESRPDSARQYFGQAERRKRSQMEKGFSYLTEQQLMEFSLLYENDLGNYLSFALDNEGKEAEFNGFLYNNILFYRGVSLRASQELKRKVRRSEAVRDLYEKLKASRIRLAREYARPSPARQDIESMEAEAAEWEKRLLEEVPEYQEALRKVNWGEVRESLGPGEVAIEFVYFQKFDPMPRDTFVYCALVLRPDMDHPALVKMCGQPSLEQYLQRESREDRAYANEVYGPSAEKGSLYHLLFEPLLSSLEGCSRIYFVPDGLLHRINLGALRHPEGGILADRYQFQRLGSTRDLVVSTKEDGEEWTSNEGVLYGGLYFEYDSIRQPLSSGVLHPHYQRVDFPAYIEGKRGGSWSYLPGTEKEVREIREIWQKHQIAEQLFTGDEGTEARFKEFGFAARSPRIIHLATHGYFFPDPTTYLSEEDLLSGSGPGFLFSEHPLIRSGLILAGANRAWRGESPLEEEEDGILTALEISQLDLQQTELVVLSACETGLGDIRGHEGVFGLQRAFKQAGVQHLLMSLWQVPDQATREFMVLFYTNWLGENLSISEAFTRSRQVFREKYPDPYYWASWVLLE